MKNIVFIRLDINKLKMIGHMLLVQVDIRLDLLCWGKYLIMRLDKFEKSEKGKKVEKFKVQPLKLKEEKNLHLN